MFLAAEGLELVLVMDFRFFDSETFVYNGYDHDLKSVPSSLKDQR